MDLNVLVGVPSICPSEFNSRFEDCMRKAVQTISRVRFVNNMDEFYRQLSIRGEYEIVVVIDELGENSIYVPFLDGFRHLNPGMKFLIVVPDGRKGSLQMSELLVRGYYNALFQRDLNALNIRDLLMMPRNQEQAANYYNISMPSGEHTTEVIKYGTETEGKERGCVKERFLSNGVKVTRMCAGDAKSQGFDTVDDEKNFSYLNDNDYGMDRVSNGPMELLEFPLDEEWIASYSQKLNNYYTKDGLMEFQAYEMGNMTYEQFHKSAMVTMAKYPLSKEHKEIVLATFLRDTESYGQLDAIINTEEVSDIRMIDPQTVNVQKRGVWYRTNVSFKSKEDYSYFINRLCTKNRVSINHVQAQIIFSDIETNENARLRFAVTAGLLNSNRLPSAHIRKINKVKKLAAQLIEEGMMTTKQAGFLINAIRNGKSMIICGGSGSGKTVLLNCLIEYPSDNICGACCQEAEELFSDTKTNIEFTHSINNKGEGKIQHTLQEIATAALLKNASIFIIGEIKGNEARDFFTAANTGAQCLCTTHALSVFEALPRIADLAKYAGDYSQSDLLKMLSRGIDYVVHMDKYKIVNIAGVVGWDEKRSDVVYDVYSFEG